jgi:predicted nucleic acid-binding protein
VKLLFVDTGGWEMLADEGDPQHASARAIRDRWLEDAGLLLSTDYVMDETFTMLRARLGLRAAEHWWEQVGNDSARVRWEGITPARAEKARHWFFRWRDKDFSYTDCTSFVVMKERRIRAALTNDRHFAQAGFEMLPAR